MTTHTYDDLMSLKGDNIIDSRQLIEALNDYDEFVNDDDIPADERKEVEEEYGDLAEEVRCMEDSCADWSYGATLILEDYFEDYAQQMAEDIGAIDADASWPLNCINWEQAARELQMDYTSVEFAGYTYFVR